MDDDSGIEKGFAMGAASVIIMLAIIFFVHEADYREQVEAMIGKPKYDANAQLITACNKIIAKRTINETHQSVAITE